MWQVVSGGVVMLGPQLLPQLAHVASREWWSCGPAAFTPPLTTCPVSKLWS